MRRSHAADAGNSEGDYMRRVLALTAIHPVRPLAYAELLEGSYDVGAFEYTP